MRATIRKLMKLLTKSYGKPARLSPQDPVGTLIRTVLSQNTTDKNSHRAFYALKAHFKSWDDVSKAKTSAIFRLIKRAGLANIKAHRIKSILDEIKKREGSVDLKTIRDLDDEEALEYLESLKGVGIKTAYCVLLFSFKRPVMPVDTHIFRVTKRLGIVPEHMNIVDVHRSLTGMVPKQLIYQFHLGIIEHGRRTCRARNPLCGRCLLYRICKYKYKK